MAEDKYGKELKSVLLQEQSSHPVKVTIIEQRGVRWLDIRKMWWSDDELKHGKGVRIEIDDGTAEDTLLVAQAMLEKDVIW